MLVSVPCSYLLWQWSFVREPVLSQLSYPKFNETLGGADEPPFWSFALWVLLLFGTMTALKRSVLYGLERAFPDTVKVHKKEEK